MNFDESRLSEEGKAIVSILTTHLDLMRQEFANLLKEKDKKIDELQLEMITLKTKLHRMEEKVEDADAYERRDTLIFSGEAIPVVTDGEVCSKIVCNLTKDKLKINIKLADISSAHRVGKKPPTQRPDRRNIIVKLCRRDLKHDILQACRELKPDFYVNESLTPARSTIQFVLRKIRRQHPDVVSGVSTRDGRVYVYLKSQDASQRNKRLLINSHLKLEEFCKDTLRKPLTSFIDRWPH